jgi:hypothetical protein
MSTQEDSTIVVRVLCSCPKVACAHCECIPYPLQFAPNSCHCTLDSFPTTMTTSTQLNSTRLQPGDIVAVRHGLKGRQEGLVIGSHYDYAVRALSSDYYV